MRSAWAQLPSHILARILPKDGPDLQVGDLADALYERTNLYADNAYIAHVCHAVIAEQTSEVLHVNAMNRARREAVFENTTSRVPNPNTNAKHENQTGRSTPSTPNSIAVPMSVPMLGFPGHEGKKNRIPAIPIAPIMLPGMNQPASPNNPLPLGAGHQPHLTRELGAHARPALADGLKQDEERNY